MTRDNKKINKKTYTNVSYKLKRNKMNLHLDCMTSNVVEAKDNILLVHGLTYSSHEFDVDYKDYSLVRFLCNNGYAVWRIDIAGYGQSDKVEYGFEVDSKYAAKDIGVAIEKIIKVTGTNKIDLLGWSWGTVTSSIALEKYHEAINKYVLYAPILTGIGEVDIEEDYHINTWEDAVSDFQFNEDGSINDDITETMVVNTYCSNCWEYDGISSPNGGRKDLYSSCSIKLIDLSKIKNKTLLICGDKDPYVNMDLVKESFNKLPKDSKLEIIKGGSHSVMMEKPYYKKFQRILIDFLKS